ncbi:sugar transferase [Altererythrobacter sp. TH136]|uniref:sugar transferase n=1 Tax=Altererythrobacter sp. TH136 TaxID=2067415 RepID=UPI0011654390|nr:sugar transferase [Altererythrobacter sp. TH136]QDM41016.1 polyprenyl glycosylphosphotransferase [Altererythrobacter sp. TH136]
MLRKRSRGFWAGWPVQLGGCILFAAVVPYIYRYETIDREALDTLWFTFVGCTVAITAGIWLLRNVTTYPGVETSAYILPSLGIAFSFLLLVFVFGRFEYNRLTLLLAFAISIAWLFYVHFRRQRVQKLLVGIVDLTGTFRAPNLPTVVWSSLSDPRSEDWMGLDAVATDLRVDLPEEWDRALASMALAGIPVFHLKHLMESLTGRVELEHLSENSFGSLIPLSAYQRVKYIADWLTAVVAIILLLPVLLLTAIAVRLSSPGPVIFRQTRTGFRGEPFTVYKFRTMRVDGSGGDSRISAMTQPNDSRVTLLGRFLRKTRLDELPQIVNILRGEMSWIGPRPEAIVLSQWYESEIPFYRYRHIVRPGITGWAQVCQGHAAGVDEVRNKLHYDFYYIKNFSPWIDALIIARTIRTMLTGYGSR